MQLDLFSASPAARDLEAIIASAIDQAREWPIAYRMDPIRGYVVTAHVDGVGTLVASHRFLYPATQSVRAQVAMALKARPQEMF